MTTYEELPIKKEYIEFIEKKIEVPIKIVSVGRQKTNYPK
jgi:adenylosuccinate synthase